MSKIVSEVPKQGRPPIYPWEEWMDGQSRELIRGEDFYSAVESFRTHAHRVARENGLKARTKFTKNKKAMILRFVNGDGTEI